MYNVHTYKHLKKKAEAMNEREGTWGGTWEGPEGENTNYKGKDEARENGHFLSI